MKLFKRLFLCIVLALCSLYTSAYDFTAVNDDGVTIYYNITSSSNRTCGVTYYSTSSSSNSSHYKGDIIIPSSVKYNNTTYLVTSIERDAFSLCTSLTSVAIPEGVTSIGDYAFDQCTSLTSVTIPEGVTSINAGAFYGCSSLTSVIIPKGVTSIGRSTFYCCTSLTSVTIPEGVTSIGRSTFQNCSSLLSVTIPEGVTSIGSSAFSYCSSLLSVTIPEGVTSIGEGAFEYCSRLISVTSLNPEPPTCTSTTFRGVDTSACVLYVPKGSISAYSIATVWKDFYYIDATSITNAIVDTQAEELYRYTIDSKRIDAPQKGINIIKYSDGTAKKVLVK